MEIKSSLLNSKEFKAVKNSIINGSNDENEATLKVHLVEYINETADNNDDEFFYDMLPFVVFSQYTMEGHEVGIACTTPNKTIYLNAPGEVGNKARVWDFIYCHECLHQLWDTFGVAKQIQDANIEYNHQLLNIASDCVINEYLMNARHKTPFENGIFPDVLEKHYGVVYDRKTDTQFTLYKKLIAKKDEILKDPEMQKLLDEISKHQQDGQQGGQQGDKQGGKKDLTADAAAESAKEAQKAANEAAQAANNAQGKSSNGTKGNKGDDKGDGDNNGVSSEEAAKAAEEAAKAAADAKTAAEKSKAAADKGDKEGEAKAAQEAHDAAERAKQAAAKAKGEGSDQQGGGKGQGHDGCDLGLTPEEMKERKLMADDIIKRYQNKMSGAFGEFVKKCKSASKLESSGINVKGTSVKTSWNVDMNTAINAFIKKTVHKKRREYESTYHRPKRGAGVYVFGDPLQKGKKIKENGIPLHTAFYIDRSGSMSSRIDNVFKACFTIAEAIKKRFKKEKVISDILFKSFVFNHRMEELEPFGTKARPDGTTMDFDEILEYILKKTKNSLINVIITDAEFEVKGTEVKQLLNEIEGLVVFITCEEKPEVKELSKDTKYRTKLVYIKADGNFTIQ